MPYKDLQTLAKVRKSSRKIRLFYFFDFMAQILKNEWNFIKKGLNGGLHTFLRQYRHYVYLVIMIFRKITKSQSQNHKINYGSIMLFLYVDNVSLYIIIY